MEGSGIDLVAELVAAYLSDAPRLYAGLVEALRADDSERVRRQAHKLKGASLSLGASRLVELCQLVEERAAQADLAPCQALVDEAAQELERATSALQELRRAS